MDWITGITIIFWISILPGSYFLMKWLFKDSKSAFYFWVSIWVGLVSMVILYSLFSSASSRGILSMYGIYGGFAGFIFLFLISIVAFVKGYREVKNRGKKVSTPDVTAGVNQGTADKQNGG